MHLNQIKYDRSHIIAKGQNYVGNNGVEFTVTSIWSDKYGDSVSYRCTDGAIGDSSPNTIYHWIWG
jgi:hypothetical protein